MRMVCGLPPEAVQDIAALFTLERDKLLKLIEIFKTVESVPPVPESFNDQLSEKLGVETDVARGVFMASLFLLRMQESKSGIPDNVNVVETLKDFVSAGMDDDAKKIEFEGRVEENRDLLESLSTPSPAWSRHRKIRSLVESPDRNARGFRTICQLRPLFEGPKDNEVIAGLVPLVLMELKTSDADDNCETFTFALTEERLQELKEVIERTQAKMAAIRATYDQQILNAQ